MLVSDESDDISVDDILESAGALSQERAEELSDNVRKMREEWE